MADQIDTEELAGEVGELLPDREVLSLLTSDPTAMELPTFLGPPETADAGAGDLAGSATGEAQELAGPAGDAEGSEVGTVTDGPRHETYSSTDTATAG